MRIECGVTTEKGPVRSKNEDNYLIGNQSLIEGASRGSNQRVVNTPCIFAVCDGMGGKGRGQEASQTAVMSLSEYGSRLDKVHTSAVMNNIETLIQKVNLEVVALKRRGVEVGTTLAFAYLSQGQIYLANVGDSRIYQYVNAKLTRLSVDHNRYQELLQLLKINDNKNRQKGANELTQFLGIEPGEFIIEPHYERLDYSDMLLLLCSDGLTSSVSEEQITQILLNPLGKTMEQVSNQLVEEALKNGSKDNITAMVVKIKLESIKGSTGMNNFDPRIFEPFWESWYIDSLIGEGSFGYVYKIYKEEFGQKYYSALKIISLPKSEAEAKEILYESTDQDTATQYFREIAEVIYKEIQIMEELKGKSNIVSFEDHKIIRKEDGIGYYILIRMELLTCLNDYLTKNSLTTRMLHTLAMDVCRALQLCQRRNIIHRDIKPANIFVSSDGDFKLGDFGIARQLEGLESGLSIKGTYSYMAPEVYMGNPYDERADIYSLGMVLYYFLNRKHAPFTNPNTTIQRYSEKQEALKRRFSGEELPDPVTGSKVFIQAVKKACAYNPEDRYISAGEFLEVLMSIKDFDDEIILDSTKLIKTEDSTTHRKVNTSNNSDEYLEKDTDLLNSDPLEEKRSNEIGIDESNFEDEIVNDEDEATVMLSSANQMENLNLEDMPVKKGKKGKKGKNGVVKVIVACLVITVVAITIGVLVQMKQGKEEGIETIVKQGVDTKPIVDPTHGEKAEEVTPDNEITSPTSKDEQEVVQELIEEYVVEQNKQGYKDYSKIDKLEKVTSLTLANNKLTKTAELVVAIHLTYLNIEGNKIGDLSGLEKLTKLEFLNLNSNKISDLSNIKELDSLNTLILSDNKIKDITELAKLIHLRELRLNGNTKLIDIDVIKDLTDLQVLDISNTSVEDISCLYKLKNLSILNLQHTSVDKKQVKELKKKIPECTVIQ